MSAALDLTPRACSHPFQAPMHHRAIQIPGVCIAVGTGTPQTQPDAKAPERPDTRLGDQNRRLTGLMKAAQAGDRAAYDNLLRESIPFIRMVVRREGVPADFIDDTVQETLLTVHRIRATYDPDRPYTAWLRTIAQRRAIDVLRSQGRVSLREINEPLAFENHADPEGNPEDAADRSDRRNIVGSMVASLPKRQREAVEQLAINGRSLVDAAAATGLTPGALKVSLHRALNTLRKRISIENAFDNDDSCVSRRRRPAMA